MSFVSRAVFGVRPRFIVLAAVLAVVVLCTGALFARADGGWNSSPITDAVPSELQLRIEESAAAYNEAVARVADLEEQASVCQEDIARLQAELPEVQDAAYDAIRADYKFRLNKGTLIDLIVSAEDFSSFISMVAYLTSVEEYNTGRIDALVELSAQLDAQSAALDTALAEAVAQKDAAEVALAEAIAARQEAQRKAEEERAARAAAAAAAAAAEQQAADAAAQQGAAAQALDGEAAQAGGEQPAADAPAADVQESAPVAEYTEPVAEEPAYEYVAPAEEAPVEQYQDPATVDWSSDKSAFVDEWGSRIDDYLSGGELAGYGSTFAAAAWDYGVDPRYSPAISTIESSQGSACFLPHNAWGWGSSSWDSWEEAIYDQVEGLARGYGSTLDYDDALKYCPPTADEWYEAVSGQMDQI